MNIMLLRKKKKMAKVSKSIYEGIELGKKRVVKGTLQLRGKDYYLKEEVHHKGKLVGYRHVRIENDSLRVIER